MILLFGKNGLLGSAFLELLQSTSIEFMAPSHEELDLLDFEKTRRFIKKNKPSKILLCAAYTDAEKAEKEGQELCHQMNTEVVRNLLRIKIPIIHFSTDYVFGHYDYGTEIEEDFKRTPLNNYGQSKYEAEKLLEHSDVPFWNVRTSWLFGERGKNFVSTILHLSRQRNSLKIIDDQRGRPTYVKDLAHFVFQYFIEQEPPVGHYHLQNSGQGVSWAELAEYFLSLREWKGEIQKISSKDWGSPVERPKNSILKNTKLGESLPDWRNALQRFLSAEK